ncbi:MAG: hypothetical protein C4520_18350 [Candidatus Abyssobacteria bacterium SURF_5]|uniref:Sulfatase N-terminal domain-containing protein n=1 Tax=Abyssobacteria bacterium (strain SURF_5) TaxID=2093360 RepID=A0A3A4NLX9_ABYX5|nr:MAG: hypothetical protein C4520_18350 [Candidatus Abyssubacteria bacterium SURF_5]
MRKIVLAAAILLIVAGGWVAYSVRQNARVQKAAAADRLRIILITLDTTRSDHLSCYGYKRETSPYIDRLAERGVKFTNCYTSMPTTDPAHVSILTSAYPVTHGVLKNGMELTNPNVVSIAEFLKKKGFFTAAIVARRALSPEILKVKGFDYASGPKRREKRADKIYGEAVKLIDEHVADDLFLWVHFFDPHYPYDPPNPYATRFGTGIRSKIKKPVGFHPESVQWKEEEIEHFVSLYDGEISYMDSYIGKLLDYLDQRFSKSPTQPFIILVGDHGETLGELRSRYNFVFGHGAFLHDHITKVPLIMSWKGRLPEGKTVDSLIESVDIAPTIVDVALDGKPEQFAGVSFEGPLLGEAEQPKSFLFVQRRLFDQLPANFEGAPPEFLKYRELAIISSDYKLIDNKYKGIELYRVGEDLEGNDLAETEAEVVQKLQAALSQWWETYYVPTASQQEISEEKKEILRSLGYIP